MSTVEHFQVHVPGEFGPNEFTEKKVFSTFLNQGPKLAFHLFVLDLPASYPANHRKTASLLVRSSIDPDVLAGILSSFRLVGEPARTAEGKQTECRRR